MNARKSPESPVTVHLTKIQNRGVTISLLRSGLENGHSTEVQVAAGRCQVKKVGHFDPEYWASILLLLLPLHPTKVEVNSRYMYKKETYNRVRGYPTEGRVLALHATEGFGPQHPIWSLKIGQD